MIDFEKIGTFIYQYHPEGKKIVEQKGKDFDGDGKIKGKEESADLNNDGKVTMKELGEFYVKHRKQLEGALLSLYEKKILFDKLYFCSSDTKTIELKQSSALLKTYETKQEFFVLEEIYSEKQNLFKGSLWEDNFSKDRKLTDATKSWMDLLLDIRTRALIESDSKSIDFDVALKNVIDDLTADYDETIAKTAESKQKIGIKLSETELKHLQRKMFREVIKELYSIDPDNFSGSKAAMAVKDIQKLFNKDGKLIDKKGLINSVKSFPEMFMSITNKGRDPIVKFGDGSTFYWPWLKDYKGIENYKEISEQLKENKVMTRLGQLLEKTNSIFGIGEKVQYNKSDIELGIVTNDGEINIASPYFLKMVSSLISEIKKDPEALKVLKLAVIKVRIAYLTATDANKKSAYLSLIRTMGDNSNPDNWNLENMQKIISYTEKIKEWVKYRDGKHAQYCKLVDECKRMIEKNRSSSDVDIKYLQLLEENYQKIKHLGAEIAGVNNNLELYISDIENALDDQVKLFVPLVITNPDGTTYNGPTIQSAP